MLSKSAAFLRSPIRFGFVLLLTLLVSFVPDVGQVEAAEYSSGFSCVLIKNDGQVGQLQVADSVTLRCNYAPGTSYFKDITDANSAWGYGQIVTFGNGAIRYGLSCGTSYLYTYGSCDQSLDRSCGAHCFEIVSIIDHLGGGAGLRPYWCSFDSDLACNVNGSDTTVANTTISQVLTRDSGRRSVYYSLDSSAIPLDTFTGAENWEPPIGNRCTTTQIGVQVDGDALTVADYDDVLYPRTSEAAQDDFVFVATFNDYNRLTDPAGLVLEYQWPNTGWLPIAEVLDVVALNAGVDSAMTFRLSSTELRYLSQVQFRCRDTSILGDIEQRRHLPFWNPGPAVTSPAWTLAAQYQSACRDLTLTRGAGAIQPGSTARLPYNLGGDQGLDLAVFAYGVSNFSPSTTPSIMVNSTNMLGGATGGGPPYLNYVAPGAGFLTFTLPATVDAPVDYFDLVFACTDDIEAGLIIAGSADLGLVGSTAPSGTCWSNAGMSLTSPASWITGIAKMLVCIAQDLLIPDQAALLDQVQEVNATVAERPPFVAVAAIVGFSQDLSSSFSATSGSGCFTGPAIPGVSASTQACAGAGLNIEPSQRSTMALLLTAPMILGLAGHMFGLLRGQSEYITEENGQMAMRL